MEPVKTSKPIDLTTWYYGQCNAVEMTEIMRNQLLADPPRLSFPYLWAPDGDGHRGPAPTDPVMIYVALPLAAETDEHCCFACSLEELIDDVIDAHKNFDDGKIRDSEGRFVVARIAERLRELADKLDQAAMPVVP
jgi:hypothetical protein